VADLQEWDTFKSSFLSQILFFGAFKCGNLARVEAAESLAQNRPSGLE